MISGKLPDTIRARRYAPENPRGDAGLMRTRRAGVGRVRTRPRGPRGAPSATSAEPPPIPHLRCKCSRLILRAVAVRRSAGPAIRCGGPAEPGPGEHRRMAGGRRGGGRRLAFYWASTQAPAPCRPVKRGHRVAGFRRLCCLANPPIIFRLVANGGASRARGLVTVGRWRIGPAGPRASGATRRVDCSAYAGRTKLPRGAGPWRFGRRPHPMGCARLRLRAVSRGCAELCGTLSAWGWRGVAHRGGQSRLSKRPGETIRHGGDQRHHRPASAGLCR